MAVKDRKKDRVRVYLGKVILLKRGRKEKKSDWERRDESWA